MTFKRIASLILGMAILGITALASADMVRLVKGRLPPPTINTSQI